MIDEARMNAYKTENTMTKDQTIYYDKEKLDLVLTHLDNTRLLVPELGYFVALTVDREAIFVCATNSDGTPELESDGHLNWTYVTAPDPEFIDRVNEIYGTTFDWNEFAGL
jgi:hypothetical protein